MSFSSISARHRPMTRTSGALQRHRASKSAQNPTQTVQDKGVWRGQPSTSGVKKSEKLTPGKRCLPLPMLSIAEAGLEPARGIPPTGF